MAENIREKRKYPRLKSLHLLSYINKEQGVQKCGVSMARTLDISPAGVRVEVYQSINPDSEMEMEIAVDENIYAVQGKVIYTEATPNNNYILGIKFDELTPQLASQLT
ncbi:MAG TPA: PilZ domain-containing protein [Deltaproteobacteria bacterium]|nr:PilZ domain-containing protein [Deltaproteobacteria bacterium]HEC32616.1 PilZ domain-containing protein [Deltaproteobacteria bacterium]